MNNLVEHIINREYDTANQIIESEIEIIMAKKLNEAKKMVAARMAEQGLSLPSNKLQQRGLVEDELDEMNLSREKPDYASIEDKRGEVPDVKAGDRWTKSLGGGVISDKMAKAIKSGKMRGGSPFPNSSKEPNNTTVVNKTSVKPSNTTTISKNNIQEEEEDQLDEARVKLIKARVRGGKVQRRKRVSNVPGMTFRSGKLTRMSPAERRRRKLGAKRGKIKRRSKMRQALMKRKRSLRKRASIGL